MNNFTGKKNRQWWMDAWLGFYSNIKQNKACTFWGWQHQKPKKRGWHFFLMAGRAPILLTARYCACSCMLVDGSKLGDISLFTTSGFELTTVLVGLSMVLSTDCWWLVALSGVGLVDFTFRTNPGKSESIDQVKRLVFPQARGKQKSAEKKRELFIRS